MEGVESSRSTGRACGSDDALHVVGTPESSYEHVVYDERWRTRHTKTSSGECVGPDSRSGLTAPHASGEPVDVREPCSPREVNPPSIAYFRSSTKHRSQQIDDVILTMRAFKCHRTLERDAVSREVANHDRGAGMAPVVTTTLGVQKRNRRTWSSWLQPWKGLLHRPFPGRSQLLPRRAR